MSTAISPTAVHGMQSQTAPAPANGVFANASLYVGDLDPTVGEGQLYDLFNHIAQVVSIRVCRDQTRQSSLGYAYVNFGSAQEAANAMENLNFTPINGKPIRIMFSHRDPSMRKSGFANVFIKNLEASIDNKALHDTFAAFGTVLSCKVAVDNNGQSKGYGFVQFDHEEAARNAINRLNGMLINDKKVSVEFFVRRQERNGSSKFTNVYVKNLPSTSSKEDLENIFGKYGPITKADVMRDSDGKSKSFGFVNFQNADDAKSAIEKLNGTTLGEDKVLYVGWAQSKSEREAELKKKRDQQRDIIYEKTKGANLYVKNLDDNINDEKLKEIFCEFGTITSCKVMHDEHGLSKGAGFVNFSTQEEARRALNDMNGKMVGRKPLYVAIAQRKEDRQARLQAHFAQMRAGGGISSPVHSTMPVFHPNAPRVAHQHMYFGQGTPALMPPQPAGFGFQQQLLPGMRPGMGPNFILPYHLQGQGQPGQRMGARRGGNAQHMQHNQPQLVHRGANQNLRYVPRNSLEPPLVPQGLAGGPMITYPFDMSGMPAPAIDVQRTGPVPLSTLSSALASATPEKQRVMLGEELFPLVERIEHEHAGKVTGMLLEMDKTEVLHLIEAPNALKQKVAEAMVVLHSAAATPGPDVTNQIGGLSLNE